MGLNKDYGDWVSNAIDLYAQIRFYATEDYESALIMSEDLPYSAYKFTQAMLSIPAASSDTVGIAGDEITAMFLVSDLPVDVSLFGSTHENLTYLYVEFTEAFAVDEIDIDNNGSSTASIRVLLIKE